MKIPPRAIFISFLYVFNVMKGFVIYQTYEVIEEKSYVFLYGRLENGENFVTINKFRPYFYIKESDLDFAEGLAEFESQKTDFKNFNGEKVSKVILDIPHDVPKIRKKFEESNIECYEADIRFPYRFMMDKGIQGSIEVEGDYEAGDRIDRVYKEPEVKGADYKPENIKILSFDIESSKGSEDDVLYCIGYTCDGKKKVFINSEEKIKDAVSCKNEAEVIERFFEDLIDIDPDVITGWNVIDFDLAYLYKKCRRLKIPFDFGRKAGNVRLKIEESFFRESKVEVIGRQVLDALALMKVSFIKVKDYKLDTVAGTILKDTKLIRATGEEKHKEIDNLWKNNKEKLVAYNLKDAELVVRIIEKTGILKLTILRSLLTGMPLDRVNASIASFDSLYIRECIKKKLVVPTAKYLSKEERIKGGYVREGIPGIYDYVVVLDFKSLYPSIIRTFNIDPYSYVSGCKGKNLIKAPNGACFRNEDGILPILIQRLWGEREKARKAKDELTRHAIKILMNSMFGIIASPSCRFFDLDIANAITHFGQQILKLTHEEINKLGYNVFYGDTDSNFVVSNAKNLNEADKTGIKIEKHINDFYNNLVKKEYNRDSFLELSYDKCFIKFLMPKLRGKEAGAKKRYAGLIVKNGKEEMQFTGLEFIRSDWTELAKKFQHELLDRVFHNKDIINFTKKFVDDIKKGEYDNLLVYRKNIRKELKKYTKTTPPHVKAARKLSVLDSNKIEYVMTEAGPEPIQNLKHKTDYEHYIKKQIKPIADSILVFFNTDFDSLMAGSKQLDLTKF